jgi:hypothetical protein
VKQAPFSVIVWKPRKSAFTACAPDTSASRPTLNRRSRSARFASAVFARSNTGAACTTICSGPMMNRIAEVIIRITAP